MNNQHTLAIRGMHDILPADVHYWQKLEAICAQLMARYHYREIRFPIVEAAELFLHSVGQSSDIVSKETYSFNDRNGDRLTLRPEGTAGCIRALVQHQLLSVQPRQRLWYLGPMFRHERPQHGRSRQFHQLGVEAVGIPGPIIAIELLLLAARLFQQLGVDTQLKLHINCLGSVAARQTYRQQLVAYFTAHQAALDAASQQRLKTNPLRILDSKNPALRQLIQAAPKITDYLDPENKRYLSQVGAQLTSLGVAYTVNPYLVRGLDYYTGLVFEWVTASLGAQGTVCAGGCYDNLVAQFGGPPLPAIGFAVGLERLILLMQQHANLPALSPHACLLSVGLSAQVQALRIAEQLRSALPHLRLLTCCDGQSFQSQFKQADKSGAAIALVLGDKELAEQRITVKYLRETRDQITIAQTEVVKWLQNYLSPKPRV